MAEPATATAMIAAAGPGVQPLVMQPPPTFPYFGKPVVPTYLPSQPPIGIGLGYGLPDAYGGFGGALGGGYFEDVKGGMEGWLDHEGHDTE